MQDRYEFDRWHQRVCVYLGTCQWCYYVHVRLIDFLVALAPERTVALVFSYRTHRADSSLVGDRINSGRLRTGLAAIRVHLSQARVSSVSTAC